MSTTTRVTVTKSELPQASILLKNESNFDYIDSFKGNYEKPQNDSSIENIGKAFLTSAPEWVSKLFDFRNWIVGIFGLKTADQQQSREQVLENFNCEPGEHMGFFKIFDKTKNELILGEDDKHLDFRVSLIKELKNDSVNTLTISTVVTFNNWFGRLYFLPVRPFHRIIVPVMLKGIIKELNKQNSNEH